MAILVPALTPYSSLPSDFGLFITANLADMLMLITV